MKRSAILGPVLRCTWQVWTLSGAHKERNGLWERLDGSQAGCSTGLKTCILCCSQLMVHPSRGKDMSCCDYTWKNSSVWDQESRRSTQLTVTYFSWKTNRLPDSVVPPLCWCVPIASTFKYSVLRTRSSFMWTRPPLRYCCRANFRGQAPPCFPNIVGHRGGLIGAARRSERTYKWWRRW